MILTRQQLKEITESDYYDGSVLHNRFAYAFARKDVKATGNIFAFIAPMSVTDNLIDLEDSLQQDGIFSDSAINFIWEIPCLQDSFGAVAFQRLFNTGVAFALKQFLPANYSITVDGDDIMITDENRTGKVSVSITAVKDGAAIGHTAININAGELAPSFAFSSNLSEEKANEFMEYVIKFFNDLTEDIFVATTKIRI